MPLGPFSSVSELVDFLGQLPQLYPESTTFAVIDKTRPSTPEDSEGALAGMISFISTSTAHLSTEIGGVIILPGFQRSHVATNAAGLMLQFALTGRAAGGMGLRRVQWLCSSLNEASVSLAKRLGFEVEGVLRWHMVLRQVEGGHRIGRGWALPPGSDEKDLGRDTMALSVCWEDWEMGVREKVAEVMRRGEDVV